MDAWINQVLSNDQPSALVLIAIFLMGFLSVFTCACNFAIIGVVAGYSGASHTAVKTRRVMLKGLAFLVGTVVSMAAIGAFFGFAGNMISESLGNYWKIAAGLVAIFFGLYSMDLVPFKLPGISFKAEDSHQNALSTILIGLAVGGLSAACGSCCNPFFPVILAASFVKGSAAWGFIMLIAFSLGFGIPLAAMIVGIGMGLDRISGTLSGIVRVAKYIGGIALVALGFYLLLGL